MKNRTLSFASFLSALLMFLLFTSNSVAASFFGGSLQGARLGHAWEAVDMHAQPVQSSVMQGKVYLYYFGFAQCPDICPSALVNLSAVFEELSIEEQAQLQMVFVTVDPERDTPEVLRAYLDNFEGNFIGLTGTSEQIATMAKQFRVKYRRIPQDSSYTMEHSSQFYLYDKKAKPRLFYHSDADATKIAQDIRAILSE